MKPTSTKPTTLIALRHGGTHLIQPLIRHLTDKPVYAPKGNDALTCVPSSALVIFLRDPRNRLVSSFRYKHPKAKAEESDEVFAGFLDGTKHGVNPIEFMSNWAHRWTNHPTGLTVRFEELMADQLGQTERIRAYLDAPGLAQAAVEYTFGKSGTWTGRHSRWQEWFGPRSLAVWKRRRGDRLENLMGYGK
jgi:hypothetical protein